MGCREKAWEEEGRGGRVMREDEATELRKPVMNDMIV
jgi:hypothetical protein